MTTKIMSDELAREALTMQLRALSTINDNEVVERFKKVPEGWELHIIKEKK